MVPNLLQLCKECQDLQRHVIAALDELEAEVVFMYITIISFHRLAHDQLREDVRKLREEIRQISDDRAKSLRVLEDEDSALLWHIVMILVFCSTYFYMRNM